MRKTSTAGTVRRRVGMAALGAAALAAVAVPGAAWANDDAASPVAQDHSVTVGTSDNPGFREGGASNTKPLEVSPEELQKMIADGQFVQATEGNGAQADGTMTTSGANGTTKVLEVSAEELERMMADGEFVEAKPIR
ncbi:hypothetical protein ACFWUP_27760 [Nocardia sp. NPDC058658]|uniref:hypothetical protein n=1 Tax=Nocardia sp. NPDC058658 TaxID=3346580 RepID=UPI0036569854